MPGPQSSEERELVPAQRSETSLTLTELGWLALAPQAALLLSFFTSFVFAILLGSALGAVAVAFAACRSGKPAPLWLAMPGTGVFALVLGGFIDAFLRHPEMNLVGRFVVGCGEALALVLTNGTLPIEGVDSIKPWPHVAATWLILVLTVVAPIWWRRRTRTS